MKHFKELAQDTADQKTATWLRYVDDTFFVVWPQRLATLQHHHRRLNSLRPTIQYITEVEKVLLFLSWTTSHEVGP
jgi:hypothetical protein